MCYDEATKKERPCKVTWAKEAIDPRISPRAALELQLLIDKANVDVTLSGGLRQFSSCQATLHACGTAVDVKEINGRDIGDGPDPKPLAMPFVSHLQATARTLPSVQENLGPAGLFRSRIPGQPQTQFYNTSLQDAHNDHVHIGFRRSLGPDPFLDPIYRTLIR